MTDKYRVPWSYANHSNKIRFFVRMVAKSGTYFQDIFFEKGGKCNPRSIFTIKYRSEILDIEGDLDESLYNYS